MANAGPDYGPDYFLDAVLWAGSPLESITAHHEQTRHHYQKIYPHFDLLPKLDSIERWQEELPLLLKKWLFEGEFAPSFVPDQVDKRRWIAEHLEHRFLRSLEGAVSVYQLQIFLSENEADDWLIQDASGLYHLHLGWSD